MFTPHVLHNLQCAMRDAWYSHVICAILYARLYVA